MVEEGTPAPDGEYKTPATPSLTTVHVPPATKTQEMSVARENKLLRDKEYQRRKRASEKARAATVSDADDEVIPTSTRRATKRARLADD
jgi:chromatin modification-related protein EAF6